MVWRESKGRALRLGMTVLLSVLLLSGCSQKEPEAVEDPAKSSAEPAPTAALLPPEPASAEELPAALAGHLESMTLVASPLVEYCEMQGADLNAYFDLVESEFVAGAKLTLSDAERTALKTAYTELGAASGRCLSSVEVRRFSQRLLAKMRPLTEP